jgi:hypothetical protein
MIEDGWPYIWGAYAVSLASLAVLGFVIALRLTHWARRARALEQRKT